jgi:hypothetical protein
MPYAGYHPAMRWTLAIPMLAIGCATVDSNHLPAFHLQPSPTLTPDSWTSGDRGPVKLVPPSRLDQRAVRMTIPKLLPPYEPRFPQTVRLAFEVCVGTGGDVYVVKPVLAIPRDQLDMYIAAMQAWRYRPAETNECAVLTFVYQGR